MTLRSLLNPQAASEGETGAQDDNTGAIDADKGEMVPVDIEDYAQENDSDSFSVDERAKLIIAVNGHLAKDFIDWLDISANTFGNKFSPRECIFEFLKLPIS